MVLSVSLHLDVRTIERSGDVRMFVEKSSAPVADARRPSISRRNESLRETRSRATLKFEVAAALRAALKFERPRDSLRRSIRRSRTRRDLSVLRTFAL